jgi:hypothetical protein
MTTRQHEGRADVIIAGVALLVGMVVSAVWRPEPMPPVMAVHAALPPVVTYSADERTLTVSEHAPRDLLICIRGRCDLAEGWVGK